MSEYYTNKILEDLDDDESINNDTTINLLMLENGLLEEIAKLKEDLKVANDTNDHDGTVEIDMLGDAVWISKGDAVNLGIVSDTVDVKCPVCDGTGNMVGPECKMCDGTGKIEAELV